MDNKKRNVHNSGPLGQLVNSGSIFKVEDREKKIEKAEPAQKKQTGYFQTQSGLEFQENELITVPADACEPWEFANRHEDDFGDLEELKTSILQNGQLQPILIRLHPRPHDNIKYQVIFGRRRHLACLQLKRSIIAIIKPELSNDEALRYQHTENEYRKNVSDYSNALLYQKLLDENVYKSQRALATALGIAKSTINDLLQFTKIDPAIISAIPNIHTLSRSLLLKVAKLSQDTPENRRLLIEVAPNLGANINSENKLVARLKQAKLPKDTNLVQKPRIIKNDQNKRLFTLRHDQRGNINVVFNHSVINDNEVDKLCDYLKSFFIKEAQPLDS